MEQNKAKIFDLQRTSLADGPGIRTTVFFKGCHLRCRWCHNPESQSDKTQMLLYPDKCTGCGLCRQICPHGLTACDFCGKCALHCPAGAREVCGRDCTTEELFETIVRDKAYYDRSGGGVTFSGGECMLQTDALCAIAQRCHEAGIHTAVDTAGDVPFADFERILPYTDLFLYDVKAVTDDLHRQGTGVSNRRILANLRRLSDRAEVLIRIPVIGGWNDNEEEMQRMAAFLKPLCLRGVELLPYHALGGHKYAALHRTQEMFRTPDSKTLSHFQSLFAEY